MNQHNIYCSTPSESSEEVAWKGCAEKRKKTVPKIFFKKYYKLQRKSDAIEWKRKNLDMPFGRGTQIEY